MLHGAHADVQRVGNRAAGQSRRNQLQNATFGRRELLERGTVARQRIGVAATPDQERREGGADEVVAAAAALIAPTISETARSFSTYPFAPMCSAASRSC